MADNDIIQTVTAPVAAVTGGSVSTGTKILAGVIIAGVICVGAYAIYALSKPKKNSLTIIKKGSGNKSGTGTSTKTTTPAPAASTTATTPAVLTKGAPTAPVSATPAMADGVTDFSDMGSAPFAGWISPTNGIKIGDFPIINKGANVSLYDTNLKSIGSTTTKTANVLGSVWGTTAAQFYVKLSDTYVDGPDFSGATFAAVEYKDSFQSPTSSFLSADGSHYTTVLHHKNKW